MIPHHQNAVNMAKALLKLGTLDCPDLSNTEINDCILESMLYEMIAGQNYQIQGMYDFLHKRGVREKDNCDVEVETVVSELPVASAAARDHCWGSSRILVAVMMVLPLLWCTTM